MRSATCLFLLGTLGLGCSWSRYDDVTENAPILLLNRPKDVKDGFGSSLAAATTSDGATLLVGGAPLSSGGAEFALGSSDSPSTEARDTGHCLGADTACYFSSSPVALQGAKGPQTRRDLCFADGAGVASGKQGVVVRCTDDVEYALPVPDAVDSLLDFSIKSAQPTLFQFGA
ncbi:MAG TPA: hypothetical protein VEQ59_12575, partial [Polyangiaceae bacterium]|nr:hypothetical protein [Polyangiaceae bacterium]